MWIREQWKIHVVFARELRFAFLVENTDAEYSGLALLELRQAIAEVTRLLGAARRVVFWIEVNDYRLTGVLGELVRRSRLIIEREDGCFLPGVDEWHPRILSRTPSAAGSGASAGPRAHNDRVADVRLHVHGMDC